MPKNSKKRSRQDRNSDKQRQDEDSDDIESRLSVAHGAKSSNSRSSSNTPPKKKTKLQQAPEPESSDSEDEENQWNQDSDDSRVAGSAVLDCVEGDMTSTWEPAEISAQAAKQGFNSLLAPVKFEEFVEEFWQQSKPFVISPNGDSAKCVFSPALLLVVLERSCVMPV
jgi:transcription elongation factor